MQKLLFRCSELWRPQSLTHSWKKNLNFWNAGSYQLGRTHYLVTMNDQFETGILAKVSHDSDIRYQSRLIGPKLGLLLNQFLTDHSGIVYFNIFLFITIVNNFNNN